MTKIDGSVSPLRPLESNQTQAVNRAGAERNAPVAAAPEADSLRLTGEATGLKQLARELGAAPADIDQAKVDAVRASLADGSYRIDPRAIANRMADMERALTR